MPDSAQQQQCERVALVAGVTGLVGAVLAETLAKDGWKVYGLSRAPERGHLCFSAEVAPLVRLVDCDLNDAEQTRAASAALGDVTHLFWVTWAAHATDDSYENYVKNGAMLRNALQALLPRAPRLRHVALQTGTKHYFAAGHPPWAPERLPLPEDTPRLPNSFNFYYALEDVLAESLSREGTRVTWSVHRPGLIFGASARSFYNVVGALAVYAAVCAHTRRTLVFPGSRFCFEEAYIDSSDAALVARQEIWASTHEGAANQAFNVVNGDAFTWKQLWPCLARTFDAEMPPEGEVVDENLRAADFMGEMEFVWEEIVAVHSLRPTRMRDLAEWWLLDVMFRIPFRMLASTEKCRRFGFTESAETAASFGHWIEVMRQRRLVP